jgi:anti-anti-sigma factor
VAPLNGLLLDVPAERLATEPVEVLRGARLFGRLVGEIDYHTTEQLRDIARCLGATGAVVHLDLAGETFMDASGISLLVNLRHRLQLGGGDLVLENVSPRTRWILQITRTDIFLLAGAKVR